MENNDWLAEKRYQDNLQRIRGFRLLDDEFMTRVFSGNPALTEMVLRIVLENDELTVESVQVQSEIKNLRHRSLRLDIRAVDKTGKQYDIEIQRADKGGVPQRARYHAALIDAEALQPGEDFSALPESCVIFITEHDLFGKGLPLYHVDRTVQELGQEFGDGSRIIYVNGEYRNDDPIGRLMYDFSCTGSDEMNYAALADEVRYYKEDSKGVESMCRVIEDLCRTEREEGRAEGGFEMLRILFLKKLITAEDAAKQLPDCTPEEFIARCSGR